MRNLVLSAIAIVCLVACTSAPPPTQAEIDGANYGARPSENEVLTGIRNWMSDSTYGLENPGSLKIRNLQLYQTYMRTSIGNVFGYLACYEWDAKKGRGGYGGYKNAGYLIKDGQAYDFSHNTNRSLAATLRCDELRNTPGSAVLL